MSTTPTPQPEDQPEQPVTPETPPASETQETPQVDPGAILGLVQEVVEGLSSEKFLPGAAPKKDAKPTKEGKGLSVHGSFLGSRAKHAPALLALAACYLEINTKAKAGQPTEKLEAAARKLEADACVQLAGLVAFRALKGGK